MSVTLKSPDEVTDLAIDFTDRLAAGETLSEVMLASAFPSDTDADALMIGTATLAGAVAAVPLGGGRNGAIYRITARVRTSDARIVERSAVVQISPR